MAESEPTLIAPSLTQVLDQINDAVYLLNKQMRVTCWNRAAERMTGYASREMLGGPCDKALVHCLADGTVLCGQQCPMRRAMTCGIEVQTVVYLRHRDGHRLPIAVRVAPARDDRGRIVGALQVFSDDIARTMALRRIDQLEQLADNDALTGVRNRRFLLENLGLRLAQKRATGHNCGCIFVDIDHFKAINDRYGHETGDAVLKAVAKTVAASLTPFDTFGRLGGEEFLALVALEAGRDLRTVAAELHGLVRKCGVPAGPDLVTLTASFGVTTLRAEDTVESALHRADQLLYRSKQSGRNCVTFDADLQ